MVVLEERNQTQQREAEAADNELMRLGLSPTVEKMFGALVDRSEEPKEITPSESEAPQPKRLGAA